jgi:tetratricopeptide (TPR) repeat protein
MASFDTEPMRDLRAEVADALERWAVWSRSGRHEEILAESRAYLERTSDRPDLRAPMLLWIAQAHLDLDDTAAAVTTAQHAWEADPSPQSTHTLAIALNVHGEVERSLDLLEFGRQLHPRATNLTLQMAMFLGDQRRVPEALDRLEEVDPADLGDTPTASLYYRLLAGLYAATGRWQEADDVLRDARAHLDDEAVNEAQQELHSAWRRAQRRCELVAEWTMGLEDMPPPDGDVDDAIMNLGAVLEATPLMVAAARRLWRALVATSPPTVRSPGLWAAAALASVMRLDGSVPSLSGLARISGCHASSLTRATRRFDALLASYDPGFLRRSFAAETNPRLDEDPRTPPPSESGAVIRFPGR